MLPWHFPSIGIADDLRSLRSTDIELVELAGAPLSSVGMRRLGGRHDCVSLAGNQLEASRSRIVFKGFRVESRRSRIVASFHFARKEPCVEFDAEVPSSPRFGSDGSELR